MTGLRIVAMCMLVVATGCERRSEFCNANPTAVGCDTGSDSGGGTCDPACTGDTPVCDDTNTCVACRDDSDCHAGDKPVCIDADGSGVKSCHACRTGADCPLSDACTVTGACAAAMDVSYVAETGASDANDCSMGAPCATIGRATMVKSTIVIEGTIDHANMINQDLTLLGGSMPNAVLTSSSAMAPLNVTDAKTMLTIFNIYIGGADSAHPVSALCIDMRDATVSLDRVELAFCAGGAINVAGMGSLVAQRATIHDNANGAINMAGTSTKFDLTNNFIFGNGGSGFGNSNIVLFGKATETNVFAFNTVAFNNNAFGTVLAAGISCNGVHTIPNNIIVHNMGTDDGANNVEFDTIGTLCDFTHSITAVDPAMLHFKKPGKPFDLHLLDMGSIAVDVGDDTSPAIDNKGTDRPRGMHPDKGADELIQ